MQKIKKRAYFFTTGLQSDTKLTLIALFGGINLIKIHGNFI